MNYKVCYVVVFCALAVGAIIVTEWFLHKHLDNREELATILAFISSNPKLGNVEKWKLMEKAGEIAYLSNGSIRGDFYFSNWSEASKRQVVKVSWEKASAQADELQVSIYDVSGSGPYKLIEKAVLPLKRVREVPIKSDA